MKKVMLAAVVSGMILGAVAGALADEPEYELAETGAPYDADLDLPKLASHCARDGDCECRSQAEPGGTWRQHQYGDWLYLPDDQRRRWRADRVVCRPRSGWLFEIWRDW